MRALLHAIARLLGAEPEMGMLAAQGPGFKLPPAASAVPVGRRSWTGQAQTIAGLLLILTGISGLAYPLMATVLADFGGRVDAVGQDTPGLMDPKYFWAESTSQKRPQPHSLRPAVISARSAYSQAPRVSLTRGLPLPDIRALIAAHAHAHGRLVVPELNLALDRLAARKKTLTATPVRLGLQPGVIAPHSAP